MRTKDLEITRAFFEKVLNLKPGYRRKFDALAIAYVTMELPELGEQRLSIHSPTALLVELVFREGPSVPTLERSCLDA